MNKKRLTLTSLLAVTTMFTTSCVAVGGNTSDYNTVTVTFNATNTGYYEDQENPSLRNEVVVKEVRYGITWGKLVADDEKPADPICNKIGYSFAFYKLGDTLIQDNYKITSDITVTAVYKTDGQRFCYDPWEIVINQANQGLSQLKAYYSNDPDYKANDNSFLGLERDLAYGEDNYKVRVIGENADELSSGTNKVAALTFEFVDLLPGFAYDANDTSHYETSSLRESLNGRVKNNIEPIVRNNLREVKKTTNEGGGTYGREHLKATKDYVFIPSMYEMGILNDENGAITEREGSVYAYYQKHDTLADRKKSYRSRSGQLVESTYWTRSPDTTVERAAWPIDSNGHTGIESEGVYNTVEPDIALGVAPCFAIGISTSEKILFATDSWTNIISTANRGLKALKERYKIDMNENNDTFVGLTHPLTVTSKSAGAVTYEVRVIGESHDHFYNSFGMYRTAPLTFQFTSVVGQKEDMYITGFVNEGAPSVVGLNQNRNWHYDNSMAERCLEAYQVKSGTMDSSWSRASGSKTLYEMIDDENLRDALRPVRKTSYGADFVNSIIKETMSLKLFPLSYNEYGAYKQNISTYGSSFNSLIKDDGEPTYAYYDYTKVTDKETTEEKYKEIERRRIFNDAKDVYNTKKVSGVTYRYPTLKGSVWAHSFLRSINMVNFKRDGVLSYKQEYAMLHPNGEANDWGGMPIANVENDHVGKNKNYRIGIVPAFCIGDDIA